MSSASTILGRSSSLIATCDQWVRASHTNTAVDGDGGELTLSWEEPSAPPAAGEACIARGLATDRLCRIYQLAEHHVERLVVGPTEHGLDYASLPEPVVVVGTGPENTSDEAKLSGSNFAAAAVPDLLDGTGIAITDDDRLFLADRGTQTISVLDLWSHRLLRNVSVATPSYPNRYPMGMTSSGGVVLAVVREPVGLLSMTPTRGPTELDLPSTVVDLPPDAEPSSVAVLADGTPVLLFHDSSGDGWLVAGEREPRNVGAASDIIVDAAGAVVIAPCPSNDRSMLRRLVPISGGWARSEPLDAAGYDGSGLVLTTDHRIGYFSSRGFRLAVGGAVDYQPDGHCVTYRLDSGVPLNRWGRLFIEACTPDGTACFVGATTTDDEFETSIAHVEAEPAACLAAAPADPRAIPLPPSFLSPLSDGHQMDTPLHRRPGSSTVWWPTDDRYETYEAPIMAKPGRYLWVTLRLHGNRSRTPRVRELRIERHAHTLLKRLPAVFAADEERADFLHRYLATFDGLMQDLESRSRCREILLDPLASPHEALDWLASFFALALDDRWAEAAQRQLIAEIVPLYRLRGTVWSVARYIEIFLAGERATDPTHASVVPVIVEHFRLRGLGGPLLGADPTVSSRSVLGHGFRVDGAVGDLESAPLDSNTDASSSFETHAHRFSVLIPQPLGAEEEGAIRHILDTERPAHTAYDLCTVDAGMRVGNGLHVGMSSIVGPTGAFESAITDLSLLGRGAILGGPTTGISVEASRLGHTTRVG